MLNFVGRPTKLFRSTKKIPFSCSVIESFEKMVLKMFSKIGKNPVAGLRSAKLILYKGRIVGTVITVFHMLGQRLSDERPGTWSLV